MLRGVGSRTSTKSIVSFEVFVSHFEGSLINLRNLKSISINVNMIYKFTGDMSILLKFNYEKCIFVELNH